MDPNLAALDSLRADPSAGGMEMSDPEKTSPMMGDGESEGEFFLPRDLFAKTKVKKGQEVWVKGTIGGLGSRIGFIPTAVKPAGEATKTEDTEERYDPDLDDEMGDGGAEPIY